MKNFPVQDKAEPVITHSDFDVEMMSSFSGNFRPGKIFDIHIMRVASDSELSADETNYPDINEAKPAPMSELPTERVLGGSALFETVTLETPQDDSVDALNVIIPRSLDVRGDSDGSFALAA